MISGGPAASPARMYIGLLDEGEGVTLMSAEDLFGTTAPSINESQIVYMPGMKQVLVFGNQRVQGEDPTSGPTEVARPEVWRFSLVDGSWQGPHQLTKLTGLEGYTPVYEKRSGKVILFGGKSVVAESSSKVFALEPTTLALWEVSPKQPAPLDVGRIEAGVFLDRKSRKLVVYGGKRDGQWLGDGWSFDLSTRQWTRLTDPGQPGTIIEASRPYVHFDARRNTLWTGDMVGSSLEDGLSLRGFDRMSSTWQEARALRLPGHITWPVEDTFLAGATHSYTWQIGRAHV